MSLRLLRGSRSLHVTVKVSEKSPELDPVSQAVDVDKDLIDALNIMGLDVDNTVAATVPGIRVRSGVLVTGKCSRRDDMQISLNVGDLIHAVNGSTIHSVAELRTMLAILPPGSPVVLKVERKKQLLYVVSEIE